MSRSQRSHYTKVPLYQYQYTRSLRLLHEAWREFMLTLVKACQCSITWKTMNGTTTTINHTSKPNFCTIYQRQVTSATTLIKDWLLGTLVLLPARVTFSFSFSRMSSTSRQERASLKDCSLTKRILWLSSCSCSRNCLSVTGTSKTMLQKKHQNKQSYN